MGFGAEPILFSMHHVATFNSSCTTRALLQALMHGFSVSRYWLTKLGVDTDVGLDTELGQDTETRFRHRTRCPQT